MSIQDWRDVTELAEISEADINSILADGACAGWDRCPIGLSISDDVREEILEYCSGANPYPSEEALRWHELGDEWGRLCGLLEPGSDNGWVMSALGVLLDQVEAQR
jgi:hypothetical protein